MQSQIIDPSYETVTPLFVVVEFELLMKAADSMLNVQSLGVFRGSQIVNAPGHGSLFLKIIYPPPHHRACTDSVFIKDLSSAPK